MFKFPISIWGFLDLCFKFGHGTIKMGMGEARRTDGPLGLITNMVIGTASSYVNGFHPSLNLPSLPFQEWAIKKGHWNQSGIKIEMLIITFTFFLRLFPYPILNESWPIDSQGVSIISFSISYSHITSFQRIFLPLPHVVQKLNLLYGGNIGLVCQSESWKLLTSSFDQVWTWTW